MKQDKTRCGGLRLDSRQNRLRQDRYMKICLETRLIMSRDSITIKLKC